MPTFSPAQVVHNAAQHRFELPIEGDAVALAYYLIDAEGRFVLTHTEVPSDYSGQGIASTLARGVFETARAQGIKLVLCCTFMQGWYARHRDFDDVVAG